MLRPLFTGNRKSVVPRGVRRIGCQAFVDRRDDALSEIELKGKFVWVVERIATRYFHALRKSKPVSTGGNQFEQMALASPVGTDDANEPCRVLEH